MKGDNICDRIDAIRRSITDVQFLLYQVQDRKDLKMLHESVTDLKRDVGDLDIALNKKTDQLIFRAINESRDEATGNDN